MIIQKLESGNFYSVIISSSGKVKQKRGQSLFISVTKQCLYFAYIQVLFINGSRAHFILVQGFISV